MSIHVQISQFEGPLALLLYLIRKEEMNILDININEITKQYFDYIKMMKELDLEVAGEFIAMAATLIHIKSRLLLPQYDENGEIVESEDPRKELVQRLIEYQKYQEAGKTLYERPLVGRDVWLRGQRESLKPQDEEIILEDNALFSLISTFRKIIKSAEKRIHQVGHKAQSIASRILEIKDRLIIGQKTLLSSLLVSLEEKKRQLLITFLSALELAKMGFVHLYQNENFGEIYIETQKAIDDDALSRVEEYNSVGAEQVASNLFAETESMMIQGELVDLDFIDSAAVPLIESEPVESVLSQLEVASDEEILKAEEELDLINEEPREGGELEV